MLNSESQSLQKDFEKNYKEKEDVEIDPRDFSPDDREPEFKNKVEESIWRLKNKK